MLGVLRRNPQFRLLWTAQAVSMTGDWLNRVAILALLSSLSGPDAALGVGLMFGVELFVRMMPTVVFGSLAGALADRWSRRGLMIGSDLIRAGVVLGYLFVDEAHEVPFLYLLLILQMGLGIFYQAARSAAVPATVDAADLGRAYELSAVTWSVILSFGALLGGVLADVIGLDGVFLCDAATYLVSATLLSRLRLPPHQTAQERFRWREVLLFQDMGRGLRHARERGVIWVILAKTFWGPAGGYLVVLPLLAARYSPSQNAGELAYYTSLFYAARGVGTGVGPIVVRRLWGTSNRTYRRQIGGGFFVAAAAYALLPSFASLEAALVLVAVAHMGGSAIWVGSTTLWQLQVEEEYRGRIYSAEFAGLTASFACAGLVTGWLYDLASQGSEADMIGPALRWVSLAVFVAVAAWLYGSRHEARRAGQQAGADS